MHYTGSAHPQWCWAPVPTMALILGTYHSLTAFPPLSHLSFPWPVFSWAHLPNPYLGAPPVRTQPKTEGTSTWGGLTEAWDLAHTAVSSSWLCHCIVVWLWFQSRMIFCPVSSMKLKCHVLKSWWNGINKRLVGNFQEFFWHEPLDFEPLDDVLCLCS